MSEAHIGDNEDDWSNAFEHAAIGPQIEDEKEISMLCNQMWMRYHFIFDHVAPKEKEETSPNHLKHQEFEQKFGHSQYQEALDYIERITTLGYQAQNTIKTNIGKKLLKFLEAIKEQETLKSSNLSEICSRQIGYYEDGDREVKKLYHQVKEWIAINVSHDFELMAYPMLPWAKPSKLKPNDTPEP